MSNEIAEFLRRAAERRAAESRPRIEIVEADVVEDAEIIDPGNEPGADVAQHVAKRMSTAAFSQRVATLGAAVDQADDRMESHLQEKFVHGLGQLGARTGAAQASALDQSQAAPPTKAPETTAILASDLMGMLRNRQQLRTAILLSEILQRPEHRW